MEQSKELQVSSSNALLSKNELDFAIKVNEILGQTQQIAFQENPIIKGLMSANAMDQINKALTPEMMIPIEKLFGSSLGIKTDKAYPPDVMKRIFIEATLGGWQIVGNQINVIGGNMYITKQGYLPRLRKIEGLKFTYPFKHNIPIQNPTTLGWSISTDMEWKYNGVEHKETITYPVKKQEGQSYDALLGKGDTKCSRWLWNKITGQDTVDDSGDFVESEVVSSEVGKSSESGSEVVKSSSEGIKSESKTQTKSNIGEEIEHEEIKGISKEFQDKLDSYLAKATGKEDLKNKLKTWCNAPQAKEAGASFSEVDGIIKSDTVSLEKFNELEKKFS